MKRLIHYPILLVVLLMLCSLNSIGQTDTINFSNNKLRTKNLKTGLKQYLVYFQNTTQRKKIFLSLWTRAVQVINRNGEKQFTVSQKWYSADTAGYRSIYSINRASDFAPVYHAEQIGDQLKAFNWYPDLVSGADTVVNNKQKEFALKLDQPCFNWNLDIETFEMLPLAAGKVFVLQFYDAGLGSPKNVAYKVTGDEVLLTLDNQKVDCWKLFTESDHDKVHYTETFWISKKDHEFLKEEDSVNGMYRYKVKLPGYATNLMERFK